MDMVKKDGYFLLFEMICKKVSAYTGIETLEYAFSSYDEMCRRLEQVISSASDDVQRVIRSYYGINSTKKESLRSAGKMYGLSRDQVNRIINNFINKACCLPLCLKLININLEECALEQLGLSGRAINCLRRSGIQTINALIRMVDENPEAMFRLVKCGEVTRNEIMYKINLFRG